MLNRSTLFYPSTSFILITYALVAAVWIVGGDLLLISLASSSEQLQTWQTWKGVGFALLSSGVLAAFALQRDRNEAELREKNTHYRTLFYGSSSVKMLIDGETGEILDTNQAALDYYGYTHAEITKLRTTDLSVRSAGEDELARQQALRGEQDQFEDTHRLEDGSVRQVIINSGPVVLDDRRLLYSIVTDVSDQRHVEELLRVQSAALTAAPFGIVITDVEGSIQWVNPAFTEMTGYALADLADRVSADVEFAFRDNPELIESFHQAVASGGIWTREILNRRKDGRYYPEEVTVTPVRDEAGQIRHYVAIRQDVTEKQQTMLELQRRALKQQALARLSQAALRTDDQDLLMEQAVEAVAEVLGIDIVNVLRLDEKREHFTLWAGFGWDHGGVFIVPNTSETQAGFVLRSPEPIISTDLRAESRFRPSSTLLEQGITTSAAVLIDYGEEPYGILSAHSRTNREFTPTQVAFLHNVAHVLAAAIRQRNYARQIEASNRQLLDAYDATIEGWAQTLDLRDHETEGHSRRVSDLSVKLGRALGLSSRELLDLRRGALLHDIGKMGVPDALLYKPGALTKEEWLVMQSHTVLAKELLSRMSFLKDVIDIPYSHHEKWDGSGYPQGLKGEDIPLAARIFAVIDVYDALTSERPYREAWSHEKALQHIRDEAGTHFDPTIVEKFLEMMHSTADSCV